jgi:hypothetical protein
VEELHVTPLKQFENFDASQMKLDELHIPNAYRQSVCLTLRSDAVLDENTNLQNKLLLGADPVDYRQQK